MLPSSLLARGQYESGWSCGQFWRWPTAEKLCRGRTRLLVRDASQASMAQRRTRIWPLGSLMYSSGLADVISGHASELLTVPLTTRQVAKWEQQVGQLHDLVRGWTGNSLQVVEMSAYEWSDHRRRRTALFEEIERDAVQVAREGGGPASARSGAK